VFDSLVASFICSASLLEELELCVVIGTLNVVDDSREPALFFNCFIGFAAALAIAEARVSTWLLQAFLYEDAQQS